MRKSSNTEPVVTPAVAAARKILFRAEATGLVTDDVQSALIAALDTEQVARAMFTFDFPDRQWAEARGWMQQLYIERADSFRAILLGIRS